MILYLKDYQMLLCMLTPKIAEGLAAGGGVPGRLSGRNP